MNKRQNIAILSLNIDATLSYIQNASIKVRRLPLCVHAFIILREIASCAGEMHPLDMGGIEMIFWRPSREGKEIFGREAE